MRQCDLGNDPHARPFATANKPRLEHPGHWQFLKLQLKDYAMRGTAFRRHQQRRHLRRRLREDRNQHYDDLAVARFNSQPKLCSCWMCGNRRKYDGPTISEQRQMQRKRYSGQFAS